jgi:hypothetical protein
LETIMAIHAPITGAPLRASHNLPHHLRSKIEAEVEAHLHRVELLLAKLDHADGDCDLEDDDPSGDETDERGEVLADDGGVILPTLPRYAVDQRTGPINFEAAKREHHASRMGLVRSDGGRWTFPPSTCRR